MPVELDGVADLGHAAVDHYQPIALRRRCEGNVGPGLPGDLGLGVVGRREMGICLDDRAPESLDRAAQRVARLCVGRLALGETLTERGEALADGASR